MELRASGLRVEGAGLGCEIWTLGSGIQGIHLAHEAAARQMAVAARAPQLIQGIWLSLQPDSGVLSEKNDPNVSPRLIA